MLILRESGREGRVNDNPCGLRLWERLQLAGDVKGRGLSPHPFKMFADVGLLRWCETGEDELVEDLGEKVEGTFFVLTFGKDEGHCRCPDASCVN